LQVIAEKQGITLSVFSQDGLGFTRDRKGCPFGKTGISQTLYIPSASLIQNRKLAVNDRKGAENRCRDLLFGFRFLRYKPSVLLYPPVLS
jgi:hypothetical protein